jgi:hypothetical protein
MRSHPVDAQRQRHVHPPAERVTVGDLPPSSCTVLLSPAALSTTSVIVQRDAPLLSVVRKNVFKVEPLRLGQRPQRIVDFVATLLPGCARSR